MIRNQGTLSVLIALVGLNVVCEDLYRQVWHTQTMLAVDHAALVFSVLVLLGIWARRLTQLRASTKRKLLV